MAAKQLQDVVAHWHKLIESYNTSSKNFYTGVEEALKRRKVPGLKISRVDFDEGGLLAPQREYLRVTGEHHCFDICAAPFGTGFFFSSWVTRREASFVAAYLIFFALLTWFISRVLQQIASVVFGTSSGMGFGVLGLFVPLTVNPAVLMSLAFLMVLWLIGLTARGGRFGPEAAILTVPIVGWVYKQIFVRDTYYRIDTMLMFQTAVHSAMLEVIDGLTT